MSNAFQPEQLNALVESLTSDGHQCSVFTKVSGIKSAFANASTKLLLLGVGDGELQETLEALHSCSNAAPGVPIILYLKEVQDMSEVLVPGIDDFLFAPLNLLDVRLRIHRLVRRAAEKQDELERVKLHMHSHFGMQQFIGKSPAFLAAVAKVPRVAGCDAPVLLSGETGTGKEMCARAIHYLSPRAKKPFIPINCGSIPADLFENEMFGHEAGAFTDARQSRRGLIAEAEGGTLFLDEIDSLPGTTQVKLLRFLQDRQYRPLGASQYRQANTRILTASNQNLLRKVQENTFREDLYYRLKVITLQLPSLAERPEDIGLLATYFLTHSAREYDRPVTHLSADAMRKLNTYNWPGNVRELENVIRQAVIMVDGPVIRARDINLPTDTTEPAADSPHQHEPFKVAKARMIEDFERAYLNDIVASHDGNISKAARAAKKDRRSFFALLKKYSLTSPYERRQGRKELPSPR